MKSFVDYILEQQIADDTKIGMGDSNGLLKFLKDEIENLSGNIKVTGDGIKYDNVLVPGTKLSLGLTAGEYADILVNWINEFEEKKNSASQKVKYKKIRKNAGVPRGSYGAAEKMKQREIDRNREIVGH